MKNKLTVRKDMVMLFGDRDDGVIGVPCLTAEEHVVEAGYFYGKKHPKNIVAISAQAGCPMQCVFCELGCQKYCRNLTPQEMNDQVELVLSEAARLGFDHSDLPYKVSISLSGEPLLNESLIESLALIGGNPRTIKVSTVFPAGEVALGNFDKLAEYSSGLKGQVIQLQISLLSTFEKKRMEMIGYGGADFATISEAGARWRQKNPLGRKINLSLMIVGNEPCDPSLLTEIFPPEHFRLRFREYVPTINGGQHQLKAVSKERMTQIMAEAGEVGYQVGDWAIPTPIERRFGLAANTIRQRYLDMVQRFKTEQ